MVCVYRHSVMSPFNDHNPPASTVKQLGHAHRSEDASLNAPTPPFYAVVDTKCVSSLLSYLSHENGQSTAGSSGSIPRGSFRACSQRARGDYRERNRVLVGLKSLDRTGETNAGALVVLRKVDLQTWHWMSQACLFY